MKKRHANHSIPNKKGCVWVTLGLFQVAGLSFLWYVGSPESKEGDERKEEKLDYILKKIDPDNYNKFIKELEGRYPKE